jgi:hypothetical protein
MIQILITIKDKETIDNYRNVHEDLIIADFIDNPTGWFNVMDQIEILPEKDVENETL